MSSVRSTILSASSAQAGAGTAGEPLPADARDRRQRELRRSLPACEAGIGEPALVANPVACDVQAGDAGRVDRRAPCEARLAPPWRARSRRPCSAGSDARAARSRQPGWTMSTKRLELLFERRPSLDVSSVARYFATCTTQIARRARASRCRSAPRSSTAGRRRARSAAWAVGSVAKAEVEAGRAHGDRLQRRACEVARCPARTRAADLRAPGDDRPRSPRRSHPSARRTPRTPRLVVFDALGRRARDDARARASRRRREGHRRSSASRRRGTARRAARRAGAASARPPR